METGDYHGKILHEELHKDLLAHDVPKSPVYIYNILDENCSCTKYSKNHLQDVISLYPASEIQNILVSQSGSLESSDEYDRHITGDVAKKIITAVPATPSVAVVDQKRKIAYYGPYSSDYFCGSSGESFIQAVLKKVLSKEAFYSINLAVVGCFCPTI